MSPHQNLVELYLQALLAADREGAWRLLQSALGAGVTIQELYLGVLQPALREVGRLWQTNRVSVAEEHYCSAATQVMMARLQERAFGTPRLGRTAVIASVGGELHELGARMVADFLEMAGWDTHYLGADTPAVALADLAVARQAHLVCLSCSMSSSLAAFAEAVSALRGHPAAARLKIMAGGNPFNADPELWRGAGADGYAPDAADAVEMAGRLVAA